MTSAEDSLSEYVSPLTKYNQDIENGTLIPDESQKQAVLELETLFQTVLSRHREQSPGIFTRLIKPLFNGNHANQDPLRGLYLWGPVGRGKSYLVDTFYDCLPFPNKTRIHFHSFMRAIHADMKKYPQEQSPLTLVAKQWSETIKVLCLDEFHVGDITDAMILSNLLEALFEHEVMLLTTSNDEPQDLYKDGLQRDRFLPAIDLINTRLKVIPLAGATDYRLRALEQAQVYYQPHTAATNEELKKRFLAIAGRGHQAGSIEVEGRHIDTVYRAEGAVWFAFSALCEGPRSVADYIEVALCHHTMFLSDVPCFDNDNNDAARRFINLIDELYDRNVNLILSAAAEPEALYGGTRLNKFFLRTVSRLREMQSHEYLARPHISE